MLHLHALVLHASPGSAEPGLPHRGKPLEATYRQGEHLHAGSSTYKRGVPTANERVAVPGMHRRTPKRRFSWDALSVTNATECGWKKCFFPMQREDKSISSHGWLVGQPPRLGFTCKDGPGHAGFLGPRNQIPETAPSRYFPQYSRAWARAEELRAGFGVDHLLRGAPLLANMSREQATYLNSKLEALHSKKHPRWCHWNIDNVTTYYTDPYTAGLHPVQGVRSCPYPECMLLKCKQLKAEVIEGFVANAPNKTKLSQGINQSFVLVAAMVKAHPCLKIDFQVFLRNDGAVLNIDLDRCDELKSRTRKPLRDSQKLRLAKIPGLCKRGSGQVFLDKALSASFTSVSANSSHTSVNVKQESSRKF